MWFVTWGGWSAPPAPSAAAVALGCWGQRLGPCVPSEPGGRRRKMGRADVSELSRGSDAGDE